LLIVCALVWLANVAVRKFSALLPQLRQESFRTETDEPKSRWKNGFPVSILGNAIPDLSSSSFGNIPTSLAADV
jgi:hypothetical protein